MFGARRRHDKQDLRDAEDFVHRLAEVRADMDEQPPTIIDESELNTRLRREHIGIDDRERAAAPDSPKR